MNKRADTVLVETVIFIALNLIFFVLMIVFVWHSGNSASVYEEFYAKKIALAIDSSNSQTSITFDIQKAREFSKAEDIIKIDSGNNLVTVNLGGKGYSFSYFSDYPVGVIINENMAVARVGEKK